MTKNWKKWRDVIQALYISEGKTLDDVRAIMLEQHSFNASTRSYRQQFDKWGIAKYNCKKRNGRRQQEQQQQQQQRQQQQHHHHQRRPRRSPNQPAPVDYSSPESTSTDADHQEHHQLQQEQSYSPGMMAVSQAYSGSAAGDYTYASVQAVPAPLPPVQASYHWPQEEQQPSQRHERWRNIAPMGAAGLPSPPADMDTAFFMQAATAAPEMELAAPQPVHPQSTYHVLSHQGGGQGQAQHHHHHQQQQLMMAQHHPQSRRQYETTY